MTDQELNVENMDDEEFYQYRCNLIKETFTEEDFLSCEKTRQRLEDEFLWRWEKDGEPKVEEFYNGIRNEMQGAYSTLLFYDINGDFAARLSSLVFDHIKREYDITIFHDCPDLAEPLIRKYDEIQDAKKRNRLASQKKGAGINIKSNKKFDWGTKTYK